MHSKKLTILKWILLLTCSRVSGFKVVQIDNLKKDQILNLLDVLKDTNNGNRLELRRNIGVNDFKNRKLVKRVIPHGYEVKNFEYDDQFKTLYKPLVRIHKRKTDKHNTVEETNRYDLMFVINDKRHKDDIKLAKESLLEPFAIDSTDIKYFSNEGNVDESIVDKNAKNIDYEDTKPNEYILVDHTEKFEDKYTQNGEAHDASENANTDYVKLLGPLKQLLEKQLKNINYGEKVFLDPMNQLHLKLDKGESQSIQKSDKINRPKPKNKHSLGPVGQLVSKQSQTVVKKPKASDELDRVRSYIFKKSGATNFDDYLVSLNKPVKERSEKSRTKTDSSDQIYSYKWFGPIGQSPTEMRKEGDNSMDALKKPTTKEEFRYTYPNQITSNIATSLKRLIERQIDRERSVESNKGLFASVENLNAKPYKPRRIRKDQKPKPFESYNLYTRAKDKFNPKKEESMNKFELLNEMPELKASELNERERKASLRQVHHKSGEDNVPSPIWDWSVEEPTTKSHKPWRPQYSLWDYWTYDKTIHVDDCKGQLIKYGGLCIEAMK